jgi:hypothetical protein
LVAPARNRAEEYRFGSITGSTQLIGDAEDEVDQVVLARPVNDPNNATRRKIGVVFSRPVQSRVFASAGLSRAWGNDSIDTRVSLVLPVNRRQMEATT